MSLFEKYPTFFLKVDLYFHSALSAFPYHFASLLKPTSIRVDQHEGWFRVYCTQSGSVLLSKQELLSVLSVPNACYKTLHLGSVVYS